MLLTATHSYCSKYDGEAPRSTRGTYLCTHEAGSRWKYTMTALNRASAVITATRPGEAGEKTATNSLHKHVSASPAVVDYAPTHS